MFRKIRSVNSYTLTTYQHEHNNAITYYKRITNNYKIS